MGLTVLGVVAWSSRNAGSVHCPGWSGPYMATGSRTTSHVPEPGLGQQGRLTTRNEELILSLVKSAFHATPLTAVWIMLRTLNSNPSLPSLQLGTPHLPSLQLGPSQPGPSAPQRYKDPQNTRTLGRI